MYVIVCRERKQSKKNMRNIWKLNHSQTMTTSHHKISPQKRQVC